MHTETVKESFRLLFKNPLLYLPDLCMAALTSFLLYIIYWYTGAADLFQLLQSAESFSPEIITGFLSEKLKEIIISGISFFFVTFVFGVGVIILKFSMLRELLSGKRILLVKSWEESKGYFWPVVFLKILIYLIGLLSLMVIILLCVGLFFMISSILAEKIALIAAIVFGVILAIACFIFITLAVLFRYPMMFLKETKHPGKTLRESYFFLRKNPFYVIQTGFIMLVMGLIFSVVILGIGEITDRGLNVISIAAIVAIISALWGIIKILGNITMNLGLNIYVFLRFKEKEIKQ